jgi:hypothetical protein
MEDRMTFADSFTGLEHALFTTLLHREHGCKTRLVTHSMSVGKKTFVLHTVLSTPAPRPNRLERGCSLAPYKAQALEIAEMYNALAEAEARPDLEEN